MLKAMPTFDPIFMIPIVPYVMPLFPRHVKYYILMMHVVCFVSW